MKIRPDILMESTSHDEEEIEKAREYMDSINGKVIVLPYFPAQSSSEIKNRITETVNSKTKERQN
jgi:bifunctional ADP-heptose synthase (sugar kinase/adenylyltransferase)